MFRARAQAYYIDEVLGLAKKPDTVTSVPLTEAARSRPAAEPEAAAQLVPLASAQPEDALPLRLIAGLALIALSLFAVLLVLRSRAATARSTCCDGADDNPNG